MGQLAADQVDVGREPVGRGDPRFPGHAQRCGHGAVELFLVDQFGRQHPAQGQGAALPGALGVAARIVVGRAFDDPDQQRHLLGGQAVQLAPEPELGSRRHAMDGLAAALAPVHLVEVGLQEGALVVARLQDHRIEDLVELAAKGLLAADAEQATAGQLLGQGAGALAHLPGAGEELPARARDAGQVDAVVGGKVAVLHRLQAGDQQLRHVLQADQAALFLALAVQGGDAGRVQPRGPDVAATGQVAQAQHLAVGQGHLHPGGRDDVVHVGEAPAGDGETVAAAGVGPRCLAGVVLLVGGRVQLGLQRGRVQCLARGQRQRTRVDPRGDLPLQRTKALAHLVVQVGHVGNHEAQSQSDQGQGKGDQAAAPHRSGPCVSFVFLIVVRVVGVVFVVVAGHFGCDNGKDWRV